MSSFPYLFLYYRFKIISYTPIKNRLKESLLIPIFLSLPKPLPALNTLYHSIFILTTPHHTHIHKTTNIFSIQTNNHHYYTFLPITTPSIYHSIQILSTKCLCIKYLLTILSHLAKTTLRKEIHRSIVLLTIHSHDPTRTWAITSTLTT